MAGVKGKSGRKPGSPGGRKRRVVLYLAPDELALLESRYGTVQKGIRALLACVEPPRPAPADAPPCPPPEREPTKPRKLAKSPPPLCERCARIGVPSCPSCRRTVEIDS
jgi:hypothetical protein